MFFVKSPVLNLNFGKSKVIKCVYNWQGIIKTKNTRNIYFRKVFQEVIYAWGIKIDLSDVPLARTDYNLINFSQSNKPKGNMEKCYFFDKGYCKSKSQCLKSHPSTDCKGQCENKNVYPLRHRVECKNGTQCIFKSSKSCEFLRIENPNVDDTIFENIQNTLGQIKVNIKKTFRIK